ncbi:MAG: hypothetical protein B6U87_02115 [Candidatus Aenigmarchaeota archaeon ex4484_52]|nr:MAG: hypothetical protein B6U87_02115 [Candidatus Aenigmarchaeota archaeon ex4484_52]
MSNKERISITLDENIISWLDRKNGNNNKNRSQIIEKILIKAKNESSINQAVILCGGLKNKFLVSMNIIDNKPVLEHIINYLKAQGIGDIILIVNYDYEKIISYFGKGIKFGVCIRYIIEDKPQGTAGFLKSAKGMISKSFVLLYGDVLCNIDIDDMFKTHKNAKAIATIGLTTSSDTSSYGVVKLKGNKITGFIEKPILGKSPSNLINAGVFIIEPEVLNQISQNQDKIMIENLFKHFIEQKKLAGYVYDGKWFHFENKDK